jgi:hypothetical protein
MTVTQERRALANESHPLSSPPARSVASHPHRVPSSKANFLYVRFGYCVVRITERPRADAYKYVRALRPPVFQEMRATSREALK